MFHCIPQQNTIAVPYENEIGMSTDITHRQWFHPIVPVFMDIEVLRGPETLATLDFIAQKRLRRIRKMGACMSV